ncbi:MAG: cohesin domain-containing protein [Patescibacteria group bacterium]
MKLIEIIPKKNQLISRATASQFQIISAIAISLFILAPVLANASVLYTDSQNNQYRQNDVFLAEILLDTENENINLGEITLNFNPEYLKVIDISTGGSVFTLWPKNPVFSNKDGLVSFAGGVPGGFKGDGKLLTIYFKALKSGQALIGFEANSNILLNDGSGSGANLTAKTASIEILPAGSDASIDERQTQIKGDNAPPEDFEIKIEKIEGKYFAIFSTTDAGSGIDRYEIKEGAGEWKEGNSPYLLGNQNLRGKITVKAVDKAGNERINEILPKELIYFWIFASLLILLILAILIRMFSKRFKKR